jgi:SAM-dependent methyltransferase
LIPAAIEGIVSQAAPGTGSHSAGGGDANQLHETDRERQVHRFLVRQGLMPLAGKRILDVGCGTGKWLRDFLGWGAEPGQLFGVELLEGSAARARRLCPQGVTIECGTAAELRFPAHSFDIVLQAGLFSSLLEQDTKIAVAAEMLRVVRPTGVILWYDAVLTSAGNPYVHPVSRSGICGLFPGCSIELERIGLAGPLARFLAPRSRRLCALLSQLSPLCTHYLGALRPLTR